MYKHCFDYIKVDIDKSKSLEELFNSVITRFINILKELQSNYSAITNINKILKIDDAIIISEVNRDLKTNFLDHLALGHNVISIKSLLNNEWNDFENNRASKLKKGNNFSDFSFIRKTLEATDNGNLKTNIDYIFQIILPQTDEVKNNNNKIKPSVFNKLLKMKTEELILWNIAKSYRSNTNIAKTKDTETTFQQYTTFNKAYKMDLEYTITIDKDTFWLKKYPYNQSRFKTVITKNPEILNKTLEVKIKVPAKRYDNKFLKVESELIKEYLLWNHCQNNEIIIPETYEYYLLNNKMEVDYRKTSKNPRIYNLQKFDDLMKVIHRDLKMSLPYIGTILRAEKKLLQLNNNISIEDLLKKKYPNENIKDFFLPFRNIKNVFKDEGTKIKDIKPEQLKNISEYLAQFRANALHYQLQDPERKQDIIKLLKFINGELSNATEQEFTRIEK